MAYLMLSLMLLFIVAYYLNNRETVAPSVLFSGSFLFGSFWAMLNIKNWSLNMSLSTYLVITFAVMEFILVSLVTKTIYGAFFTSKPENITFQSNNSIDREQNWKWKVVFFITLQILSILFISKSVLGVTGSGSITAGIGRIYATNATGYAGTKIMLPDLANRLAVFTFAVGIFFGYHFVKKLVFEKKANWSMLFSQILGMLSTLFSGHRGQTVFVLIALLVFYYFFTSQKNNWVTKNNFKYLIFIGIGLFLVLSIFQLTTIILGRGIEMSSLQYISIYTGAEMKNLDSFIRGNTFPISSGIWGGQTFYNQIPILEKIFGFSVPQYSLVLPFQTVNGYNLGNVYTTLYPWLYDFGYKGVAALTAIIAFLSQSMYFFARSAKSKKGTSLGIMLYGYFSSFIALAFFSNKFFENITVNLIYYIVIWVILGYVVFKEKKV